MFIAYFEVLPVGRIPWIYIYTRCAYWSV